MVIDMNTSLKGLGGSKPSLVSVKSGASPMNLDEWIVLDFGATESVSRGEPSWVELVDVREVPGTNSDAEQTQYSWTQ